MKTEKQYIYYLLDPRTNEVKYVGMTKNPKARYTQHIKKLDRTNTPKRQWLVELFQKGLKPKMKIAVETTKNARQLEQEHLNKHKNTALNIHNPGKGVKSRTPDEIG